MLVRFYGKNFRSFRDEFELSMVAADLKGKEDQGRGVIEVPLKGLEEPLKLLRTVAIYGPNASGKSTVLTAANALSWLVSQSSRSAQQDAEIPTYEPFVLDKSSRKSPVELGCDVVLGGSLLSYTVSFDSRSIRTESLRIVDGTKERLLIDRTPDGNVSGVLIDQSQANQLYVEEMQPNVAVISKLAQHGPTKGKDSVRSYFVAIMNALRYKDYSVSRDAFSPFSGPVEELFAEDQSYQDWVMEHLMRNADLGICGVTTRREKVVVPDFLKDYAKRVQVPEESVVISFLHSGKNNSAIDFAHESSGTRKLFHISHDLWNLAIRGRKSPIAIWVDELGAGIHPRLLDQLVRALNDEPDVEKQSQLVFATHDPGLLEGRDGLPPALRRDQVFFTKKRGDGASELYALIEFKNEARSVHNIRKRYMSGLYSAIPVVDKLSL